MTDLRINFSWRDATGCIDDATRQSMADLAITVNDQPVTRVFDRKSRTMRDPIFVSLYPIAEWIAANWWFLLEENIAPGRSGRRSYDQRHSLTHAGDGFALPALSFIPEGEVVLLQWRPRALEHQPIEFVGEGEARLPRDRLREVFSDFVDAVVTRITELGVPDSWLGQEWDSLSGMETEESDFCRAAARMGLDPFDLPRDMQELVVETAARLPSSMTEDVFRCATPASLHNVSDWLLQGLDATNKTMWKVPVLSEARQALGHYGPASPWEAGYGLARDLRARLDLPITAPLELKAVLGEDLPVIVAKGTSHHPALDGIVAVRNGSLSCYTAKRREDSQRFFLARAMAMYLERQSAFPAMLSGAVTQSQKRSRAFAAELLAPAEGLKSRLSSDSVGEEEIEELARSFEVSSYVVLHQIVNHKLATVVSPIE